MGADIRYSARFWGPCVIQRGQAQDLSCPVYLAGALVAPASGSVSIYNASGEAVVDGAAVSVVSSLATYTLSAPTTAGQYTVLFDTGALGPTTTWAVPLVVSYSAATASSPAGTDLCTVADVRATLEIPATDTISTVSRATLMANRLHRLGPVS